MQVKLPAFKARQRSQRAASHDRKKLVPIVQPLLVSRALDHEREMSKHEKLTQHVVISVYFCDSHSPWQRGSNENMNGPVGRYLHKEADMNIKSQQQLGATADEINECPGIGRGERSSVAADLALVINRLQHSTLIH
jgi:IS30 family transposase